MFVSTRYWIIFILAAAAIVAIAIGLWHAGVPAIVVGALGGAAAIIWAIAIIIVWDESPSLLARELAEQLGVEKVSGLLVATKLLPRYRFADLVRAADWWCEQHEFTSTLDVAHSSSLKRTVVTFMLPIGETPPPGVP